MTKTEDRQNTTIHTPARPTQMFISAQRITAANITDIALVERVMDGSLPFVWTRSSTPNAAFPRLAQELPSRLPTDAVVTRTSEGTRHLQVFAEGPDYVVILEVGTMAVIIEVAATSHEQATAIGGQIAAHFPDSTRDPGNDHRFLPRLDH